MDSSKFLDAFMRIFEEIDYKYTYESMEDIAKYAKDEETAMICVKYENDFITVIPRELITENVVNLLTCKLTEDILECIPSSLITKQMAVKLDVDSQN